MTTIRFERRMSDQDALMWAIEKDPLLRSTITSITLFDAELDRARLLDQMDRATREIPRLRQRVVSAPLGIAPPTWVVDPDFDLDFHVRFQRAPGAGTLRDLLDYAQPFAMSGFDRARPLWEFVVFDRVEGGRSALVQKMHHSLIDGVGAMKITMAFLDTSREGRDRGPVPPVPASEQPDFTSLLRDGLEHDLRRVRGVVGRMPRRLAATALDPVGTVRRSARMAGSLARMLRPVAEPMSPIMGGRSLSVRFDALTSSLPDLKAAAKAVDATLNDAFVGAVAGGLKRYHDKHGAEVDELRMTMPINTRPSRDEVVAGNEFVPARFTFPLSIADPAERIRVLSTLLRGQRDEPALQALGPVSTVLNQLPLGLSTAALGSMLKRIDVVTSNVPGAPIPIYAVGARMEANFGFGPLTGAGANITLLSYLDEVHLGISTDPAAVPDPEVFVDCLQDGFDEVLALGR
jgi:diacylglycerol O-acyltransferase / wax synthase